MRTWQETISWAEGKPHEICPGDMQYVVRDLLEAIRVLGTQLDDLKFRVITLEYEAQNRRLTSYEPILGEIEKPSV